MQEHEIQHIADTAMWIAAYRALESERSDAVFKDTLAGKLAGPRGYKMVEQTPGTERMAFAMVTRTTAIDRLIYSALSKGVTAVINLGAGLDTRPYRMNLPSTLSWVEVDFPGTISYKNNMLKNDVPVCKLQRLASDLADEKARKSLLSDLGKEGTNILVITEGVIGYLTPQQATNLSRDIHEVLSFRHWIMDYSQGRFVKNAMRRKLEKEMLANSPLKFDEPDPITFFKRDGWRVEENIYILDEADRLGRKLPASFPLQIAMRLFPKKIRELGNKTYGYVMFKCAER
ncbi:MAG TPA: SAM-dependent methyltransferase [Cyclobacteriaceae bacterium]|nr:SAM-dependent methyltransferase [Cyclobacteriaceae bacterium]